MAKQGPETNTRGDVLQPHVDAGILLREPARQASQPFASDTASAMPPGSSRPESSTATPSGQPAPEGVRADGHRGRRRDERALLPGAGGGRGGDSGSSCRIMSPTRSRCTWCTRNRRSCPSNCGASRSSPRLGCASRWRPTWPSRPAPKRRSSHLTCGRSFMHDKNNSNSRGKTTGAALDTRLSQGHTRPRAARQRCYSKTSWTP